jgi:6,7-dimethyl-8-ribityllumazine synthase
MKVYEGRLIGQGRRIGIVVSRFNDFITRRLLDAAEDMLIRLGVNRQDIRVAWVPGSFEIPFVTRIIAEGGDVDGVIALGCVIRGETQHYDVIIQEIARGLWDVMHSTGIPVIFGIITADELQEAIERAGTKLGNRGAEAARCALEMIDLISRIKGQKG